MQTRDPSTTLTYCLTAVFGDRASCLKTGMPFALLVIDDLIKPVMKWWKIAMIVYKRKESKFLRYCFALAIFALAMGLTNVGVDGLLW